MKYIGKITEQTDLTTKKYVDDKISKTTNILQGDGNGNAIAATTGDAILLDIDSSPTSGSNNLITSGGVKTMIDTKPNTFVSSTEPASAKNGDIWVDTSGDADNGDLATKTWVNTSLTTKENKGKITIGTTEYSVVVSTTDEGTSGCITFVVEE